MRRRIVLLASVTALFAVVLLSIPLGIVVARNNLRDERLELLQRASTVASRIGPDMTETGPPSPSTVDPPEAAVTVYDASGRRRIGTGPLSPSTLLRTALGGTAGTSASGGTLTAASPITDGDRVVGAVVLSANLDAVHARNVRDWMGLAALGLGAILISASGALVVSARLSRPISRLADTARDVGAGNLGARAELSGIAEVDVLAAILNDTVSSLESLISRERALSSEVSHQLRTPLSGLRLDLEGAMEEGGLPPGVHTKLVRAWESVDRLERTIDDVITLARGLPTPSTTAVEVLLEGIRARWHASLTGRGRPLRILRDEGSPTWIALSRRALDQILDVLVDNAVRHGSGAVSIRCRRHDEDFDAIDVVDEGPGLAVDAVDIFRREPGSTHGLGLPYARRLAEAEGARLTLTCPSPPTFTLLIAAPR